MDAVDTTEARAQVRGLIMLSVQWSRGKRLTRDEADAVINLLLEPENIQWIQALAAEAVVRQAGAI